MILHHVSQSERIESLINLSVHVIWKLCLNSLDSCATATGNELTNDIHSGATVGVSSRGHWALRKINTVGESVGPGESWVDVVVVAGVRQRVSKNENGRHFLRHGHAWQQKQSAPYSGHQPP